MVRMFRSKVASRMNSAISEMPAMMAGVKDPRCPSVSRYPAMMVAPTAPMAPAWLTVAMPAMIDPSTARISARGGTRASTTRTANSRSKRPSRGMAGALLGRMSATVRM